jgi:hypothetical protein
MILQSPANGPDGADLTTPPFFLEIAHRTEANTGRLGKLLLRPTKEGTSGPDLSWRNRCSVGHTFRLSSGL